MWPYPAAPPALVITRRLVLTRPSLADETEFLQAVANSQALHRPWVAPPATAEHYRRFVSQSQPPQHHPFLLRRREGGVLVGCINLSNVVMGAFCGGHLGYFALAGAQRQGLMTEGLNAVVRHAFAKLGLHRVEANIQPGNLASVALARACGFSLEGYSPRYLKINGRWRDHERWARLKR